MQIGILYDPQAMVQTITHAIHHLFVPVHRLSLWRRVRHHLIFRPAGRVLQLWRDARVLSLEMIQMLWRWRMQALLAISLALLICIFVVSPHDLALLGVLQSEKSRPLYVAARWLSRWGDFLGFNLIVLLGIFAGSLLFRSRFLRLVVVASFLGATFTGGTANVCRFMLGRARPSARVAPGFYGPSFGARFHACPSGHTATAFGGSIPIAVALPPVGIPLMLTAGGIAWSRMHNNAHHPTDILLSSSLALLYGVPLGLLARRMRRHRRFRMERYAVLSSRRTQAPAGGSSPAPSSSEPSSVR